MNSLRALFVLGCALVVGCAGFVRTGYNNADTALRFVANDYFSIDDRQTDLLRGSLDRFHTWHRRQELPRYAALFEEAAQRVERGLQRDDVLWAIESVRTRYRSLMAHGVDEAMPVLATVNDSNLEALQQKFDDKNEEYRREFLRGDAAAREEAQLEAYKKRWHDWIGELSPEQEKLTLDFIRAHPQAAEFKLQERKRRQAEVLQLLRNKDPVQLRMRLQEYFSDPDRKRGKEQAEFARRVENDFADYLVALDRSLSPGQRDKARQRLLRYAQDARALAAEGKTA